MFHIVHVVWSVPTADDGAVREREEGSGNEDDVEEEEDHADRDPSLEGEGAAGHVGHGEEAEHGDAESAGRQAGGDQEGAAEDTGARTGECFKDVLQALKWKWLECFMVVLW